MGKIMHHSIIVTCFDKVLLQAAHSKALELKLTASNIIVSAVNGYYSFFISPNGSKFDRIEYRNGDISREEFKKFLNTLSCLVDWIEVQYGNDYESPYICDSNTTIADKKQYMALNKEELTIIDIHRRMKGK